MSPSSNPLVSERVLVCQNGSELAEFVALLEGLGVPVTVHGGPLPTPGQVAEASLVIASGQRLTQGKAAALRRWPRTIAVVDDGSRTLNAHLGRLGVSLIVRRPIHPRALRLVVLHALYRGPERRNKRRVMIGQPIRAGGGLFKQSATLLELSRTGARLEFASPPKIGALIQFVLGKELTHGKPITLQAKVVRTIRAADGGGRTGGEVGVALVDPGAENARVLQAILDRHSIGVASLAPARATGATTGAATTSSRSLENETAIAVARTAPAIAKAPIPPASARPGGLPDAAAKASSTPLATRTELPPSSPRRLPPSHVPTAPIQPVQTQVEILATTTAPALVADACSESAGAQNDELDRLEGDESDLDYELELDEAVDSTESGDDEAAKEDDRRRSARVPYSQRVVALDEQAARVVVGRDLSHGGMRIAPNPELAVGDVVKLALHAGNETEPLVVLAGVERDDGEEGLLLAFAALTPTQRLRLDQILDATSSIVCADSFDGAPAGGSVIMGELLRRVSRGGGGQVCAGFTLIELMIVVAIIGLISSVAIPLFGRYQLRSKSSEVKANLSAIRVVQEAHRSEHGVYLPAAAEPTLIPGPKPMTFDVAGTNYAALGWGPDGSVYFSYAIETSPDATGYTADAAADIDGDGILQIWGYSKPDPLGALTPGGLGCNPAVLDAEEVGSCIVGPQTY